LIWVLQTEIAGDREFFFSLLVCVREKGREREGAPASWLWFSAAAGERERGSTREVWAGLQRLLWQNLGLVLCEISTSSLRLGFSVFSVFSSFVSLPLDRERGSTEMAGLDSGVVSGKL
jgi:hypothetical protein